MKHPKVRKDLIAAISITLIYLVLSAFTYHLDKFFPGIPVRIIIHIFFGILVLLFIMQLVKTIRRKKKMHGKSNLKWVYYSPLFVLTFGILYFFSPFKLDSEKLQSKVYLRGCYQGNSDQAIIRFRKNKSFEIIWTTESGSDDWYFGTYTQNKDTLFLSFDDKAPDKIGSTVVNTGTTLLPVDKLQRPEKLYILFTVGYCKDINGNTIY